MGHDVHSDGQAAFAAWGPQMWMGMLANGPWTPLAPPIAQTDGDDKRLQSLRSGQHEFVDETKELLDRMCDRRHQTVQSTWSLMDELRQAQDGSKAMGAWMSWYQAAMSRYAEDIRDQMDFTSKSAKSCSAMMSGGLAACSAPLPKLENNGRAEKNGRSRRDS